MLEILPGSGYNEFNEVDEENRKLRLEKEDIWMKKLRTIYPYGLNERAKQKVSNDISLTPVGSIFPSLRQHCNAEKRYIEEVKVGLLRFQQISFLIWLTNLYQII